MLSTLVSKTTLVRPLANLRAIVLARPAATSAVASVESGEENKVKEVYENWDDYPKSVREELPLSQKIHYWKKANEIFFGPQRDVKNFPDFETPDTIKESYNFYMIPSRWFTESLYPRLGVSGCYSLVVLSSLFILNKELVDMHEMTERLTTVIAFGFVLTKLGSMYGVALDKKINQRRKEDYEDPLNNALSTYNTQIADITTKIDTTKAIPIVYEAKQETLDLQLESQYRQRIQDVYAAVKNRLDYAAAKEAAERKFEQEIMVNWIVDGVKAAITPQSEKQNFMTCIKNLQALSKTATV
ncbi:ATP synthase subunit b, mitochondrial-like [Mya arenaria]|uniref:ATP synthase subunit b, mitochondrial-like n=1 Tax=Mya arenaria TaxID=6604 RepID=UPI0022E1A0A3|nr:ATP synthase subunit b, mitochondrial-like [Mya arenaria]